MALERKDNIGDTTTSTGTGTINLDAVAQSGSRIFAGNVTSGSTVRYDIRSADNTEWEIGEGVFTDGSPDTLTRVTVYASSNAGSLVNFSAGTKNVSMVITAKDIIGEIAPQNLLKNGNFINNSTNGYGSTPDDWTSSNANPVQGGIPALTKQNLIDGLGVADGDIEALYPCNGFVNTDDIDDLSSNAYDADSAGHVPGTSLDGLMGTSLDFEAGSSQYGTVSAANANITTSQTFFCFIKPETFVDGRIMGFQASGGGNARGLIINANGTAQWVLTGLATATINSDVVLTVGKWNKIVGIYSSSEAKLKLWINGVKKEVATSGTVGAVVSNFSIGRLGDNNTNYYDGLIQNACVLSVALTDNQVKKLFAMTMYKGQKIRRATTNGYLYQQLPQDLVERLRGKTVALRADIYQEVASTAQISIHQTMADGTTDETIISATDATTGSWLSKVATGTLEADVVTVEIRIKHSTSDGNTWFRNVSLYEGSTLLPYDHSKEDWNRFPRLLKMDIPKAISGYQFEENREHSWTPTLSAGGSMTFTSTAVNIAKFLIHGKLCHITINCSGTTGGTASNTLFATLPIPYNGTANVATGANVSDGSSRGGDITFQASAPLTAQFAKYDSSNFALAAGKGFQASLSYAID